MDALKNVRQDIDVEKVRRVTNDNAEKNASALLHDALNVAMSNASTGRSSVSMGFPEGDVGLYKIIARELARRGFSASVGVNTSGCYLYMAWGDES